MALYPMYNVECVCNQKPFASRDVRRASRETFDTFRETDSESAVHLLRLLNSNLPFTNPRRARSIHALAVPATTVTLVSQIFRHLVTLHGRAPAFSLSRKRSQRDHRFVRDPENSNYYNFFFPPVIRRLLTIRFFYTRSLRYRTGNAYNNLFFFLSLSPDGRISQDSVIPTSGFTFPSHTTWRCSISGWGSCKLWQMTRDDPRSHCCDSKWGDKRPSGIAVVRKSR